MPKAPVLKPREVEALLARIGFVNVRHKDSTARLDVGNAASSLSQKPRGESGARGENPRGDSSSRLATPIRTRTHRHP